jgi:hypothetical protein
MAVLEGILVRLPGPVSNMLRLILSRPRPDVRILELKSTGGSEPSVNFTADIANYGTQPCRCEVTATVGDEAVQCQPAKLDLNPNTDPKSFRVLVPRPGLGDLVPQFNNETTLYDKTLLVQASSGRHKATAEWHEVVYTPAENSERHRIQQRVWRSGRGEETVEDARSEHLERLMRKRAEMYGGQDG